MTAPYPSSKSPATHDATTWVVCLCADWCRACKEYQFTFLQMAEDMANKYPHSRFVWIDVEDRADLVGDLYIETFPTLLVGDDHQLNFLGAVMPQPEVLRRLLHSLLEPGARHIPQAPATQQIIGQLAGLPELWVHTELLPR